MNTLCLVLIVVVIYFISVAGAWLYFHYGFSDDGIFFFGKPTWITCLVVFTPIVNTIFNVIWLIYHPLGLNSAFDYISAYFRKEEFWKRFLRINTTGRAEGK